MRDRDGFIEVCFPVAAAEVALHRESVVLEEEDLESVGEGKLSSEFTLSNPGLLTERRGFLRLGHVLPREAFRPQDPDR